MSKSMSLTEAVTTHFDGLDALVERACAQADAFNPASNDTSAAVHAEADVLDALAKRLAARASKLRHAADHTPPVPTDDELSGWIVAELGDDAGARVTFDANVDAGFSELDALRSAKGADWQRPVWWLRAQRSGRACAQSKNNNKETAVDRNADDTWLDDAEGLGDDFKADDVRADYHARIAAGRSRARALADVLIDRGLRIPSRVADHPDIAGSADIAEYIAAA